MRQKSLVIGLLVVLAFLVSGFTYAYWATSVTGNNDTAVGTITVGEGNTVATTVVVGNETSAGPLVPVGLVGVSQPGSVDYVILSFTVDWNSTSELGEGTVGVLSFGTSDVEIDGSAANIGLLTITYQIGGTVTGSTLNGDGSTSIVADGSTVTVYVKITMSEPASQAVYAAVADKDITFTGTFTVTV
jgi:hypothetical protein